MSHRPDRRTVLQGLASAAALASLAPLARAGGKRPNILFISIDDLNDWVGILGGHEQARTPNIDRLARRGVSFTNAHCAAPACNPSRTATLLGVRPSSSGVYGNDQAWRPVFRGVPTLPMFMRRQGYRAMGSGKVFHFGDPDSWDDYYPDACSRPPDRGAAIPTDEEYRRVDSLKWGPSKGGSDGVLSDQRVAKWVGKQLKKKWDQPFFLACGFFKPHLPWHVPQQYFDMYPKKRIVLPPHLPEDMEDIPDAGRRMAHMEMHQHVVAQRAWAGAVQGYLAALTFADTMLGEVLDALDASPHREDTLIVFWTDHGWSLGEKFHWKKFALWEECTRVPLVIAGPGIQSAECSRPVSLVDLYPTLAQLVGADVPPRLEGASLVPQLRDPTKERPFPAVTTHGFRNHAVRDERYRYIRYADGSEELYDHDEDPNEWNNLVRHPRYAEQRARLAEWLPQVDTEPAPSGKGDCNGGEDE